MISSNNGWIGSLPLTPDASEAKLAHRDTDGVDHAHDNQIQIEVLITESSCPAPCNDLASTGAVGGADLGGVALAIIIAGALLIAAAKARRSDAA
jgi:hypothetical protein